MRAADGKIQCENMSCACMQPESASAPPRQGVAPKGTSHRPSTSATAQTARSRHSSSRAAPAACAARYSAASAVWYAAPTASTASSSLNCAAAHMRAMLDPWHPGRHPHAPTCSHLCAGNREVAESLQPAFLLQANQGNRTACMQACDALTVPPPCGRRPAPGRRPPRSCARARARQAAAPAACAGHAPRRPPRCVCPETRSWPARPRARKRQSPRRPAWAPPPPPCPRPPACAPPDMGLGLG